MLSFQADYTVNSFRARYMVFWQCTIDPRYYDSLSLRLIMRSFQLVHSFYIYHIHFQKIIMDLLISFSILPFTLTYAK